MQPFQISINGKQAKVEPVKKGVITLYIITFTDGARLAVTRGTRFEGGSFWTSIPEGRQEEAEKAGLLIDAHLKTNHKENVLL